MTQGSALGRVRTRLAVAAIAASVLALLAACTSPDQVLSTPQVTSEPTIELVVVTRGDITSVVTAPVIATARPHYVVLSSSHSRLTYEPKIKSGLSVSPGSTLGRQGNQTIAAPFEGLLVEWLVPSGTHVQAGVPVATIAYSGFGVTGTIPAELVYRLKDEPISVRVEFVAGPGLVECNYAPSLASPSLPLTDTGGSARSTMEVLCLIPESAGIVDGLPGTVGITTATASDVLRLPVTAVTGRAEAGQVYVLRDGVAVVVDVVLGITDGMFVEIREGLEEGDEVLPYSPSLIPQVRD